MDGVILAAGIGSRLRPLTLGRPKSCVSVAGKPIIERQLEAYASAGIEDVFVVAGYLADEIVERCRSVAETSDIDIEVVTNELYANTDNLYSLSLLEDALAGEPFILTNGDVAFEEAVLESLHEVDGSAIACDTSTFSGEAMKITLSADGTVDHIAKDIGPEAAHASSIDAYRFSASFSAQLFEEAARLLESRDEYSAWTELAIDNVLTVGDHAVEPVDIAGSSWVEIDDEADLLRADRVFSHFDVTEKAAVFIDLDGTLHIDGEAIDGAADLVAGLRNQGIEVFFLSNNSSRWKTDYAETLETAGIPARPADIVLSTDGVVDDLGNRGVEEAFVVGTEAFRDAVRRHGIDPAGDDPEVVVVGFDTELTYEKVRRATLAIRDGAPFLLAHPDLVCPTAEGFVPDCGSIGALIESATGRAPDAVFGKPNAAMIQPILAERNIDPSDVAIIGDRLETEIRMAETVGCDSVIVLTGDADRNAVEESELDPTLVARSVAEIAD